jgi:hypothetical protein
LWKRHLQISKVVKKNVFLRLEIRESDNEIAFNWDQIFKAGEYRGNGYWLFAVGRP